MIWVLPKYRDAASFIVTVYAVSRYTMSRHTWLLTMMVSMISPQ